MQKVVGSSPIIRFKKAPSRQVLSSREQTLQPLVARLRVDLLPPSTAYDGYRRGAVFSSKTGQTTV
jgi:hypothetical protein